MTRRTPLVAGRERPITHKSEGDVMKTMTTTLVALAMLVAGSVVGAAPAKADGAAVAQGGFQVDYGTEVLRTIEFTAIRDAKNNQRGNGHLFNHATGLNVRFIIVCLYVNGNVATFTGYVVGQENSDFPYFFMQVKDNGEGSKSNPDQTSGYYGESLHEDCSYWGQFDFSDCDIEGGNIQVR
jgi:hypothetical protein